MEAVQLLGQPTVTLRLSTERAEAFCVARLCDVASDGQSTRIALGARNLALADDLETASGIEPGKTATIRIDLGAVAHRFAKGHRIRLALSNTYWPMLWPSAHAGSLTLTLSGSKLSLPTCAEGQSIGQ